MKVLPLAVEAVLRRLIRWPAMNAAYFLVIEALFSLFIGLGAFGLLPRLHRRGRYRLLLSVLYDKKRCHQKITHEKSTYLGLDDCWYCVLQRLLPREQQRRQPNEERVLHLGVLPEQVQLLAEARHRGLLRNVPLLEDHMIRIQRREGIEEPALIRHSLGCGDEASAGVAELAEDLLVELVDEDGPDWWLWARARLELPVLGAVELAFPDRHHHFLRQPDKNKIGEGRK